MFTKIKTKLVDQLKAIFALRQSVDPRFSRHPERFNEDGTPRTVRFFSSIDPETGKPRHMRGTFPEGENDPKDSRQVRRRKIRVFLFNTITNHPVYGAAPRSVRRHWAKTIKLQRPA